MLKALPLRKGTVYPTFNLVHNDPDGELADTLRIWKGHSNKGGLWASVVYTGLKNNVASFNDQNIVPGTEYYYFAEIKQADGQWIVTSPIWYKASTLLPVAENNRETNFAWFPNPVSGSLSISASEFDNYTVTVTDVSGRAVLSMQFAGNNCNIQLSGTAPGIYQLEIKSKSIVSSTRLIIQ